MIPTQAVAPSQEEILKQIPTRAHITNRMVAAFKVSLMMLMMLMMMLMLMMMMIKVTKISIIFYLHKESERPTAAIAHVLPQ